MKQKYLIYSKEDILTLYKIYRYWRKLSILLKNVHGRTIHIPEALSEGAFCIEMNTVRIVEKISNANSSFDVYDIRNKKRI